MQKIIITLSILFVAQISFSQDSVYINYIKEYCFGGDIEINHSEADKALKLFLISLGYSKLVNIYEKVEKWYV